MTNAQMRAAIESVLAKVPPQPMGPAYSIAVRDALRPLMNDMPIEVFHRNVTLHVGVVRGSEYHEFVYDV